MVAGFFKVGNVLHLPSDKNCRFELLIIFELDKMEPEVLREHLSVGNSIEQTDPSWAAGCARVWLQEHIRPHVLLADRI